MKLTYEPEELSVIAARIGMKKSELSENSRKWQKKGLFSVSVKTISRYYHAEQFVIGIYEYQAKNKDREFYRFSRRIFPYLGMSLANVKTRQMRYIPMASSVSQETQIAPYNHIRDLIAKEDIIAVQQCICKQTQTLQDNVCHKPRKFVCIRRFCPVSYRQWNRQGGFLKKKQIKSLGWPKKKRLMIGIPNAQKLSFIVLLLYLLLPEFPVFKTDGTSCRHDFISSSISYRFWILHGMWWLCRKMSDGCDKAGWWCGWNYWWQVHRLRFIVCRAVLKRRLHFSQARYGGASKRF